MTTAEKITALLSPVAESAGMRIARAQFADRTLRIFVEKPGGTGPDADELAKLSREFSAHLDVEDPIRDRYFLEVSSPGAEMAEEEFREILKKTKGTKK
ncbi:MAG: hypothetical protein LBT92_00390 [Rickettsiales bacterium]|jgi:ribosome maturation factor RimP|nr:hypothetical protein [Rickettsiales bacterium]